MIPQTNPKANYLAHQADADAAVRRVLDSGWYILGKELEAFEREFAAYVGAGHAVGVANGTDAIELALRACGVAPGNAVFTVSHTAVATVAAVERAGAVAVLVDIDPATYTMDPRSLEAAIRALKADRGIGAPRAVVVVHLYGQAADLDAIADLCRRHDLVLIEDCAQCHGAAWRGRRLGSFGAAAAFSFYPTKNLGALGDGGMVVTSDAGVVGRLRMLREYGWKQRYVSDIPGVNSRLDELQAAVLRAKLPHLDEDNARRQRIAAAYDAGLRGSCVRLPTVRPGSSHVYHQYVVRSPQRDALKKRLLDSGVGTLVHYPVPVHLQPAYAGRIPGVGSLRETEAAAREVLSLPMFPELAEGDVRRVVEALAG